MATTMEQFSLRWNNYHSNLTSGFHDLLQASDMVDVTLAVEGQFLQAHKLVLSICSPYFKQLFKVNRCEHPIVILSKEVALENVKDILEFMYLGEVNVLRDNLTSFLRTAELLQVKGLTGDDTVSNWLFCLFLFMTITIYINTLLFIGAWNVLFCWTIWNCLSLLLWKFFKCKTLLLYIKTLLFIQIG